MNAFILSHANNAASPQPFSWASYGPPNQLERCWFGTSEMPELGHPENCASIVHYAADPSPPVLRFLAA
jgi:hypothetical protein